MRIEILPAAEDRIEEIWQYTLRTWGRDQANDYLQELGVAIEKLPAKRSRWRTYEPAQFRGLYFFQHRHHYIFFSELDSETLGIITILHENMNLPARFREDFNR